MFVRHGVYRGAAFRFVIRFPSAFPRAAPQVQFVAPVPFHPCVNADTGVVSFKFDEKLGSGVWSPENCFVFELLVALKRVFYELDDENVLSHQVASNHEACALLGRDRAEFDRRATLSVVAANQALDNSIVNDVDQDQDEADDVEEHQTTTTTTTTPTTTASTASTPATAADDFDMRFTHFGKRHEEFWAEIQANASGESKRSPPQQMSAAALSFIRSLFN